MKILAATDAKNRFGELIDMAGPGVSMQRHGCDVPWSFCRKDFPAYRPLT